MADRNVQDLAKYKSRRELDALQCRPMPSAFSMSPLEAKDIDVIHALSVASIDCKLATRETFHRVLNHHPDITFVIRHRLKGSIHGFFAFLLLSSAGREAVEQDRFIGTDPAPHHLAQSDAPGAALYSWISVAPRLAIFALPHAMATLRQRQYAHLDIYSRPGTIGGERIMSNLGFQPVVTGQTGAIGELMVYRRTNSAARPEAA